MAIVTRAAAEVWKKIAFYYDHVFDADDTTLSTANADGVANVYDRNESTIWQVNAGQQTSEIYTYDTANGITCDYIALGWHNFGTLGATIWFAYSDDGGTFTNVVDPFIPSNDNTIIREFDSETHDYWGLFLTFTSGDRPQAGYIIWGEKTELDYNLVGFEPNVRQLKDIRHINDKGYLSAINARYTERRCNIQLKDLDGTTRDNLNTWHETIRSNQFFVGWENDNHENDSFIMRQEPGKLFIPIGLNGRRKSANINLIGKV